MEPPFDVLASQRVAVRIEEALLGRDHRPRAVAVDRAAFHYPVGRCEGQAGAPRQPLAHVLVAVEVVLVAPAVEAEALRPPVLRTAEDDRPRIAQPDIPERFNDDLRERRQPARALRRTLMCGDQADDLALP